MMSRRDFAHLWALLCIMANGVLLGSALVRNAQLAVTAHGVAIAAAVWVIWSLRRPPAIRSDEEETRR